MEPQPNPYASPAITTDQDFSQAGLADRIKPASQGLRFANLIVDRIISFAINYVIGMGYGTLYVMSKGASAITEEDVGFLQITGFILGIFCIVAYYIVTEALFQRTPAKFITGTKVVTDDGRKPSFGQIVGRSFARLIPFEAFSFFGGEGYPVGWHDSMSGTRVVKA